MNRAPLLAVLGLLALAFLASTVMFVDADETAIVYRFGAVHRVAGAGLGFRLPRPIERDERVPVTEVRRAELGKRILLTGDTNLVEIGATAQYTVADPVAFTVAVADPDALVRDVVSSQLAASVSRMEVDALLTTGRAVLEQQVLGNAQSALDALSAGARLEAIELSALQPPEAVVAAFNDVSSARGDRDTMILSAQSYASKRLPEVRGQAAEQVEQARTAAAQRLSRARGEVGRFTALLPAWRADRDALRRALLAQAAAGTKARVLVAEPGREVVLGE